MAVIVTGVFPSRDQTEAAVETLRERGFSATDVGIVLRGGIARSVVSPTAPDLSPFAWIPGQVATSLAEIGNVVIAGQIADCAARQTPSRGQIRLTDALVCLGIERDHADWYNQQIAEGYNLVTVRADDRASEAQSIMRRFGSIDVPSRARAPARAATLASTAATTRKSSTTSVGDLSDVKPGFDVFTADGTRIGTVQEVSAQCVHVLCCSNMYVPPSRVERVAEDRVVLNVAESDLDEIDWSTCQVAHHAEYAPGGPGYLGVPPQEHEAGADVPVDLGEG